MRIENLPGFTVLWGMSAGQSLRSKRHSLPTHGDPKDSSRLPECWQPPPATTGRFDHRRSWFISRRFISRKHRLKLSTVSGRNWSNWKCAKLPKCSEMRLTQPLRRPLLTCHSRRYRHPCRHQWVRQLPKECRLLRREPLLEAPMVQVLTEIRERGMQTKEESSPSFPPLRPPLLRRDRLPNLLHLNRRHPNHRRRTLWLRLHPRLRRSTLHHPTLHHPTLRHHRLRRLRIPLQQRCGNSPRHRHLRHRHLHHRRHWLPPLHLSADWNRHPRTLPLFGQQCGSCRIARNLCRRLLRRIRAEEQVRLCHRQPGAGQRRIEWRAGQSRAEQRAEPKAEQPRAGQGAMKERFPH